MAIYLVDSETKSFLITGEYKNYQRLGVKKNGHGLLKKCFKGIKTTCTNSGLVF